MTEWEYMGEYPIEMGGFYVGKDWAIKIVEIDSQTVQIDTWRVTSSETRVHQDDLEPYILEKINELTAGS